MDVEAKPRVCDVMMYLLNQREEKKSMPYFGVVTERKKYNKFKEKHRKMFHEKCHIET